MSTWRRGLVLGSAVLIGADPGIGKSTLLLQLAAYNFASKMNCLYITGEESLDQIKLRAIRLKLVNNNTSILAATNLEDIIARLEANKNNIDLVVIDSIQTIATIELSSPPGTVLQIRTCANELVNYAKQNNIIILLSYHVTKDWQLAGPTILEHLVDTVLYFAGDHNNHLRILRSYKNRAVILTYRWMNINVLTDSRLYEPALVKEKKAKAKISLLDSFKMIFTSKYIGYIALLLIAYGVSVNLVEEVWKSKVKELYPTKEAYTMYMGRFQFYQGWVAIAFIVIGSNILRKVSWMTAAMITPLMMLLTGAAFFAFIIFDSVIAMHLTGILASGPLALGVMIGMIQNVLSKGVKYSSFDATKNMAYIPLDKDLWVNGQAAVEVIGVRFGKSGGAVIQSTFFILFPAFGFVEATPYFASVFFVIVILWVYAVKGLNKEYQNLVTKTEK